jgi:hypothetical protein
VCLLSEAGDILPEREEESWEEDDEEELAGEDPSGAPGGGGAAGHASGADDGGEIRSVNNAKGQAEMEAVKALGFPLLFKGYDVEAGIRLFEANKIQQVDLGKYGLSPIPLPGGNKAPPFPPCAPFCFLSLSFSAGAAWVLVRKEAGSLSAPYESFRRQGGWTRLKTHNVRSAPLDHCRRCGRQLRLIADRVLCGSAAPPRALAGCGEVLVRRPECRVRRENQVIPLPRTLVRRRPAGKRLIEPPFLPTHTGRIYSCEWLLEGKLISFCINICRVALNSRSRFVAGSLEGAVSSSRETHVAPLRSLRGRLPRLLLKARSFVPRRLVQRAGFVQETVVVNRRKSLTRSGC